MRSVISDRSSSAIDPTSVMNMRPIAPDVSMASRALTNSIPISLSSSTISKKFFVLRAILSNAATRSTSNSRLRALANIASKPARLVFEPETPRSWNSRMTV